MLAADVGRSTKRGEAGALLDDAGRSVLAPDWQARFAQ
jgi:hypothetical protein